jgi:hypothetical protein
VLPHHNFTKTPTKPSRAAWEGNQLDGEKARKHAAGSGDAAAAMSADAIGAIAASWPPQAGNTINQQGKHRTKNTNSPTG